MASQNTALPPGKKIQVARNRAGMTAAQLGRRVNRTESWVRSVEAGSLRIGRAAMAEDLSVILGLPVDDLMPVAGEPPPVTDSIGGRVRALRMQRGLTREQFAERVGVSKSWIEKVERGVRKLERLSTLERVAAGLDVTLADLLGITCPTCATNHPLPPPEETSP